MCVHIVVVAVVAVRNDWQVSFEGWIPVVFVRVLHKEVVLYQGDLLFLSLMAWHNNCKTQTNTGAHIRANSGTILISFVLMYRMSWVETYIHTPRHTHTLPNLIMCHLSTGHSVFIYCTQLCYCLAKPALS